MYVYLRKYLYFFKVNKKQLQLWKIKISLPGPRRHMYCKYLHVCTLATNPTFQPICKWSISTKIRFCYAMQFNSRQHQGITLGHFQTKNSHNHIFYEIMIFKAAKHSLPSRPYFCCCCCCCCCPEFIELL